MSFLLDTDTCSAYVKGIRAVVRRVTQYGGRLYISTVTLGELRTWALMPSCSLRLMLFCHPSS
jgi:predicted nucleic acid-binding protein